MKKAGIFLISSILATTAVSAEEFQIKGEVTLPIPAQNPQGIRSIAIKAAKRRAVINAINQVLGANMTDSPEVAAKIDEIAEQLSEDQIIDSRGEVIGTDFSQSITLSIDDKAFRVLVSDKGIAVNSAAVRASSILSIMDEYLTTERDLRAPLMELTEYSSSKGSSFSDKSSSGSFAKSASAASAKSASAFYAAGASAQKSNSAYDNRASGSASARQSGSISGSNSYGDRGAANFSGSASGKFDARNSGSSSSKSASAAVAAGSASSSSASVKTASSGSMSKTNVASEDHDNVTYRHLVQYQPQATTPEKINQTQDAVTKELSTYDIRVIDNSQFRSKYFGSKGLSIEQMANSEELAKYVAFAKSEAKADFLMVGTSIIIDQGKNLAVNQTNCTGVATIKVFSTMDGENIASETVSEGGAGGSINECSANVAKKMAAIGGTSIGRQIQDYWKRRSMYGQEYVIALVGANLNLMTKMAFSKALAAVPGIENVARARVNDDKRYEMTVTYKGGDPLDQATAMGLMSNPVFSALDSVSEGSSVTLCLGPCAAIMAH